MPPQRQKPQTTRTLTEMTFTKAIAARPYYNIYGVDTSKKWASQRIINEAAALEFIRANTTIPVPKVHEIGESENGTYLTVERVDGIELGNIGQRFRQLPLYGSLLDGHKEKKCGACQASANKNAATFITKTMLPQLAALRPNVSGFNGSVIPPPWVTEHDRRAEWKSKVRDQLDFVFCHGDLGPQNLLCDPQTLEVRWVIDWENAGFFEDEFSTSGLWTRSITMICIQIWIYLLSLLRSSSRLGGLLILRLNIVCIH
jgi:aminoglycoside phosphotransferase